MVHLEPLDLARLSLGAAVLAFASYTDWRWRRAPNVLWVVTACVGAVLVAMQFLGGSVPVQAPKYLVVAAIFAGMTFGLYRVGLLAGGADAKALMALAVLAPFPVELGALPLWPSLLPTPFAILGNALLAFLVVPLGLLARNLTRGHVAWPFSFLAVRIPLDEARRKHVWPMEYMQDGQVKRMLMPSRFEWEDEDWEALAAAGRTEVWVTPKVPFMVPLLVGFVSAFLLGDLLFGTLLGRLPV